MRIEKDFSLKNYNTFKIDVNCRYFAEYFSENELLKILKNIDYIDEKKLPIGVGSNILFTKSYDGMILKNGLKDISIISEDADYAYVKAGGGVIWDDMISFALERNLGGIENLIAIPGTVGASPVQNIGAYGQEAKDTIFSVEAYMIDSGEKLQLNNQQCAFGYRKSIYKNELKNKTVVANVVYKLNKRPVINYSYGDIKKELEALNADGYTIRDISNAIKNIRGRKLPDTELIGSAGSFFKNPEIEEELYIELKSRFAEMPGYRTEEGKVKVPAGWLIEQAGWKGKEIGNVATYRDQALVIINKGGAAGAEIVEFSEQIKNAVSGKFSINLEAEVNII